jgi:hypothetical protein
MSFRAPPCTLVRVTKNKNYLVAQCYFESIPLDRHAEVRCNDHSEMFSFRGPIVIVTTVLTIMLCFETNFGHCCTRLRPLVSRTRYHVRDLTVNLSD